MTRPFILIALLLEIGCAQTKVKEDYPFLERILRQRGEQILTWQRCILKDWVGDCRKFERESYDITQEDTRRRFSDLGFACKINQERFHICENEGKAGFCQQTFTRKWLSKKRKLKSFIGHNEIVKLKDGGLKCFSTRVYDFKIP